MSELYKNIAPTPPKKLPKNPKVALVCDWLTTVGGAEKVLLALHELYPTAPIYTSQYNPKKIDWFKNADVRTGRLQNLPFSLRRFLAPLRAKYFDNLDLSDYDLIISVTGAEAKGIKKGNALHLCYCHVPTQYYWQMYDDYLKNPGFGALDPLVRLAFKTFIKPLRKSDFRASQRPDQIITISTYAKEQIKKYYHRDAIIIPPPVEVEKFASKNPMKNRRGFITTSRQVTWKRHDLAIKACIATNHPLTLIGDGPEHKNLVKLAAGSPLINFLPTTTPEELKKHLELSEAFLFPSLEPFGIAPVEALAAGTPVIAFAEGGSKDFIKPNKNGITFKTQTTRSLIGGIKTFENRTFNPEKISATSLPFSKSRFKQQIRDLVAKF